MENQVKIIVNAIRCKHCGFILYSRHRHDYVEHDCNGKHIMTDGGTDYLRRSANYEDYEDLTLYSDDPFEKIRERLLWGTYGKSGKEPLHYIILKDMTDLHLEAICAASIYNDWEIRKYFIKELEYRKENNVVVEDTK